METLTNADGIFKVQGNDSEIGWINPKVNILHNCNDDTKECWRKVVIYVPKAFISESATPEKIFDIGTLNLDAELPGEARDCLN
ncbi:unnamed protein product, partial [Mesorhabditis belari]|uniref:Transthyretin-like family protein n=1 Tax=Mesorhabditis belari TaxID=2138241 RepID=A0AAF3EWY9_9BILA